LVLQYDAKGLQHAIDALIRRQIAGEAKNRAGGPTGYIGRRDGEALQFDTVPNDREPSGRNPRGEQCFRDFVADRDDEIRSRREAAIQRLRDPLLDHSGQGHSVKRKLATQRRVGVVNDRWTIPAARGERNRQTLVVVGVYDVDLPLLQELP
ncbi:MAG TPA: hypothetical protein VLG66_13035, partial [Alphaproteobacteria bacterium]|nr:hypothetical protein [Alphaproteobacteria bacterium]